VDEAVARGDVVVFAGHHNWRALSLPSRIMLRALMSRLEHPLVYLSAHTHRGFWAEHRALAQPAAPGDERQLPVGLAPGLSPHQLCL
jgi:hypothetical protein